MLGVLCAPTGSISPPQMATPFTPLGTTAYAWTHQDDALQQQTLDALAKTSFSKLRMGLFPKHYLYNANEPDRFVFPRAEDGWDLERFDLEYFARPRAASGAARCARIEADLILFHPYDRWGFSTPRKAADDRYVTYVCDRLAAFPNVWWSLANEYDLLLDKKPEDWDRIGRLVRANDPYGHPLSIHNWVEIWDYASDWATHCSIQRGECPRRSGASWRRQFGKPVIVDECGYEGDLDQGWGCLPPKTRQPVLGRGDERRLCHPRGDVLLRRRDGVLGERRHASRAESGTAGVPPPDHRRISTGRIDPLPSDWDAAHAGVRGEYQLISFGAGQPAFRTVKIPAGMTAHVDVIDSWNMTVERLPGEYQGTVQSIFQAARIAHCGWYR